MRWERRPRSSVGTYGLVGVLAHPSRLLRHPSPELGKADIEAVRRGEARRVSCWLRGSIAPLRPQARQGWLDLCGRDAQWRPYWSLRRPALPLNGPVERVTTRPPDDREPAGTHGAMYGPIVVYRPRWRVVTCRTASGWFELVVPAADVPLVIDHFIVNDRPVS